MAKASPERAGRCHWSVGILALLSLLCGGLVLGGGWMIWMPGRSWSGPLPPLTASQESLRDALRRDVHKLAAEIGDRNLWRYAELTRAAEFIERSFALAGHRPRRESFSADGHTFHNVIAEIGGGEKQQEILIVGSHYDTCPGSPGANDNASAVAALLAIGRAFADARPRRALRLVAFANEEPPYFQSPGMGSLIHARGCRDRGERIVGMISLETIGFYTDAKGSQRYPFPLSPFYPSTGNYIAFVGDRSSASLVRACVGAFRRGAKFPSEGGALPRAVEAIGLSDHWSFWQCGYPALMVTDTAFFRYEHYHTAQDTPDKLDYDRLARVTDGLIAMLGELLG